MVAGALSHDEHGVLRWLVEQQGFATPEEIADSLRALTLEGTKIGLDVAGITQALDALIERNLVLKLSVKSAFEGDEQFPATVDKYRLTQAGQKLAERLA